MLKFCLLLAAVTLLTFQGANSEIRRFHGYKVLRAEVSTADKLQFLSKLRYEANFDFWSGPELGGFADVMAAPEQLESLQNILDANDISYSFMITDLESIVAEDSSRTLNANGTGMNWNDYQSLETIYNWLEELERNSSLVTVIDIGKSTENRTLKVVKISTGRNGNDTKPAIWVDGTIHAREWISTSTVTYTINELLTTNTSALLNAVDFYFLPVINPDGYEYSRKTDRLWRKSRSAQANSSCFGVDLNRNFGFHFGEEGSSSNPCSDTFSGSVEFSDPESRAVRDYVPTIPNLRAFITTHSYSQLWMTPWGWSTDLPANYNQMKELADKAVAALETFHGTKYKTGSSANILYKSAGTSRDWAKGKLNITYVYTVELRDTGSYGFVLPPEQIIPTGEETYAGIITVAKEISK